MYTLAGLLSSCCPPRLSIEEARMLDSALTHGENQGPSPGPIEPAAGPASRAQVEIYPKNPAIDCTINALQFLNLMHPICFLYISTHIPLLITKPRAITSTMATRNLLDWPETVVPVQTLSNSGMSIVPQQYIKPPSERPSGSTNDPTLSIPVIDLASFSNVPEDNQAMVKAIADACKDWGFFQLVNHDVDMDVVKRMKAAWREFFYLPMDEKKVYANLPATYEGYGSRLGVEKAAVLDWNDYYFLNLLPSEIRNLDKWPKIPTDLREATEKYACQMMHLCEVVLKAMSSSLGLDDDYLHSAFGGSDCISACMRVNYYPRCPQPELTLGLSSHSDPGGITLLLADDNAEGTQVRKGDAWVTVQPVPGSFLVNVGDQIQILSNGRYKSVEHRALANSEQERFTIAFFCNPRGDLLIAPAAELVVPESPALYQKPVTFNEYRKYVRTKGPSGRTQVESI